MQTYDLIIIGGGPAGYLAGERAGHAGMKAIVIEKRSLGGVCLNEGCIPSKALLNSAKIFDYASHGEKYGVKTTGATIDHAAVVARKDKVVNMLVTGVSAKLKQHHCDVLAETAVITGKRDGLFTVTAGKEEYAAKRLLVASGSVPVIPPIPGLKEGLASGLVLTNREILDLKEKPDRLVIVGGGVIGLEMASYFCSIGSQVTVIEMLPNIAGATDREISGILLKNLTKKGIRFNLECKVTAITADSVEYEDKNGRQSVPADKVLMSIGRRAFTEGLGLDTIGVYTERGAVKTDEHMQTNVSGVYAAGDVNGMSMLAHTAYREAEVAINHMLGKRDRMRYNAVPGVIYTSPEVASVGETLDSAKAKGYDCREVKVSMRFSGRYLAEVEGGDGICKLILDNKRNVLMGVHLIGSYASEIIYGAALMIEQELLVEDIQKLIFPHPTVCEVIREGLF